MSRPDLPHFPSPLLSELMRGQFVSFCSSPHKVDLTTHGCMMASNQTRGILDVVRACDNYSPQNSSHSSGAESKYAFKVNGSDALLGYITQSIVERIQWSNSWSINHNEQSVTLFTPATATIEDRSMAVEETLKENRKLASVSLLQNWRNETFPVYGPEGHILLNIERCASALFGIVTYGVQLLCYVRHEEGLRLWIGKRSPRKQTYPGMLDTTAAGGLGSRTLPFDALVSEAYEEASLLEATVREKAKPMSELTYFHMRGDTAGGESGLFQPEVEYTYAMELNEDFIPRPRDSEVESFKLFTIDEALHSLKEGEFKPNSAIVIVKFLIQQGILTRANESDYDAILTHLHRKLEFPVLIQPSR
ncbi:unnamed protein product [Penicillium salamii]|nr:unnamed protein product [Penicillium salamii]